ncbi:polymorphic toxin-type HINT domain-containing protein [Actinoplanes sp. KI2]|uniref:polymorphic toxin-type HINT domain-containing protein n=1 Tax=Actinoplanes sp. KI2 TaxID=2983315 RepID=UPI0021D60E05|nr:polymorphic toxin-type HINT domain-containing protein [Actinoplanes sp. KI2]MCU7728949.1 polymorphic toxin-type HINT domain-containing protein [Actinoplanes sp. KI2]
MTNTVLPDDAAAAPRGVTLPTAPATKRVTLGKSRAVRHQAPPKPYAKFDPSGHASLPGATTADVTLTAATAGKRVPAGSSPVSLWPAGHGTAPIGVRVQTVDQKTAVKAGVHGVMFTLKSTAGAGAVGVTVDDTTFRNAYGGDYAARLHLVRLPGCALTQPTAARCQTQTPLTTPASTPLSAQVTLTAPTAAGATTANVTVLAATTSTSSSSGDYTATSLSPGGTWSAAGNTGAFTYSYPVSVPAAVGGAAPTIALSYNSSSQDARTEGTNDQSSWLGDGWSSTESYIERTYKSCTDVTGSGAPTGDGDQCWDGQILTLSLNGTSTPIVYDAGANKFRPADDDSTTKIEDLSGTAGTDNGTSNREYFRVTEDGVQYYFGLNRLPGWAAGDETTQSAWTVPVYRAHAGVGDCPDGSFADTACTLGYRFNLDYSVDLHGNATAYYYTPETGYYGADMKNTAVAYTRGGTLKRIDYGMTASTIYSATAPEQVVFDATAERCIAGAPAGNTCSNDQFTVSHPEYWPDTPIDLNCAAGATDCTNHGASFWSRKRLTSITTQVQVGGATKQVDRYDFTQTFPDGGDHPPTLWLASITHTGLDRLGGAAADTSAGTVSFGTPLQLPNRVGTLPGPQLMYHNRIQTVLTETGAETTIVYNTPDCSGLPATNTQDPADTDVKAFASTNKTGCFPVYWTPEAQPAPLVDWFYTHPVRSVTTTDGHDSYQDGSEPELVTEYSYVGNPGWHYDDNEVTKAKYRTWGQFRGYPEVDVTTGDPSIFHKTNGAKVFDQKTLTKTYYFLGMNGDTMPSGTRSVPALTSQDGTISVADNSVLAGQVFETDTYTGVGGTIDNTAVTVPTIIGPTATRTRSGLPALTAQMVRTAKTVTRQSVSYGWRKTEKDSFYNTTLGQSTTGMEVQSDDRGEVGAAGNTPVCTFTRYVDGAKDTLVLPAEIITTTQDCNGGAATPTGTLTADARTSYDNHGFVYNGDGQSNPALPTAGDATLIQTASTASGTTVSAFVDTVKTAYDSYGRKTSITRTPNSKSPSGSSLSQSSYSKFSPATGALPTQVTTITQVTPGASCAAATSSSKDCELATTVLDPARQQATAKTNVAGQLTSLTYDALGQLTAVWLPNKSKAAGAAANLTYTYQLSSTGPTVITSNTLLEDGTYSQNETLSDAFLRPLETQKTGENGSITVTDTQYDSNGWTVITNNGYSAAGTPSSKLVSDQLSQVSIPDSTVIDHDGRGHATLTTEEHNGIRTWDTRVAYRGDTTTVLPPQGGVATTTAVDARGRTTRLDQYTVAPTLNGSAATGYAASGGTSQAITYEYTPGGKQSKVTGPDGSVWTYGFDLRDRQISSTDPDSGTTTVGYDDANQMVSTTDARNIELDYTYDLLGRKLTATDKTNGNFKFASWTYDTVRIGQPTSSTRYVPGVTGGYTVAATGYTALNHVSGTTITLPAAESPLPTTYTTKYTYSTNDELLTSQTDPRTQGLIGETITYNHDTLGAATTASGTDLYAASTVYTDFGQPSKITMGASTNQAAEIFSYDDQTLRLTERTVSRTQAPGPLVDDTTYTYDAAGNPLSTVDKQSETGSTITDTQCYQYDGLNRLTQAWSAVGDCPAQGTDPTAATVSSSAGSYWQSYAYSAVGNRTQVVDHSTTGGVDATTTYHNACDSNCAGVTQPHTLASTSGGSAPTTFGYDPDGHLQTRTPTTSAGQSLKWDDEGNLAEVDTTGASPTSTKYLYDADGHQLIRRDPGRTTLFAGDTQIVVNTSVTPNVLLGAVRTYSHGGTGQAIATRSSLDGGTVDYLFNDPHGTGTLALDTTTQQASRHQYTPYGTQRGSANATAWPDMTHGYLGAAQDTSTGYTDLGARKYDPALGRFISVDPVLETTDANQLGGYAYAGDNPISHSDPSGLCNADICAPNLDPQDNGKAPSPKPKHPRVVHHRHLDEVNNLDGSIELGGIHVDVDAVTDVHQFAVDVDQQLDSLYNTYGPDWSLDDTSKLLRAMNLACALKGTACRAIYAKELWDTNAKRLDYLTHCGSKCTLGREIMTASVAGLVAAGAEAGAAKAYSSAESVALTQTELADIAAGTSSPGCLTNSFSADTKVLMSDGSTKPISQVRIGDKVLATDPATGKTAAHEVTALHVNTDTQLTDLTIKTPDGRTATLHTTAHHPIWSPQRHKWVDAAALGADERLAAPIPLSRPIVGAVRAFAGSRTMYNLTVADIHTYYVLAGNTPVLVHNDGGFVWVIPGPNGELLPGIPDGATGTISDNGKGMTYQIPRGTEGVDPRVTQMRVMEPTSRYPNGYVVYMNQSGQTVNPTTGRTTMGKSDPYGHIGLAPSCK